MYTPYTNYPAPHYYQHPTFSTFSKAYWERSLFQRMRTMFKFDGLLEGGENQVKWDKDSFLYGLLAMGFYAVFESRKWGIVFQPAAPTGIGLMYQPTGMTVNSPYFSFTRPLIIGRECSLIKLTPDFRGVWDLIEKCSSELMYMDVAIRLSQVNARFAYAIAVSNQKDADSVKAILQKFENGEPGVTYDARLRLPPAGDGEPQVPWVLWDRELKKNFILPELLDARKVILDDFYRELGVRAMPDKKERYIQSEVQRYDDETFNRREAWNITLQESLEETNRMFGIHLTAEFNEPPREEEMLVTQSLNQGALSQKRDNRAV